MAFKVGDKVKLLNGGNKYPLHDFVNGEIYKVIGVTSSAFGGDKRKRITIINDSATKGHALPQDLKLVETKLTKNQRISSLEKDMEQMRESFETLRKDYFHDIELLQERFQKKIASLEQTLTNFAEFRQSDKPEVIEFEGGKYRKVDRKASKDDIVAFKANKHLPSYVKADKLYRVLINTTFLDEDEQAIPVYNAVTGRTFETVDVYEPIQQDVQRKTICCSAATQIHGERPTATWYEESVELPIVKVSASTEFAERVKECSYGGKTLYGALDTYQSFYGFVDAEEQILFAKVFAGDSYVPASD